MLSQVLDNADDFRAAVMAKRSLLFQPTPPRVQFTDEENDEHASPRSNVVVVGDPFLLEGESWYTEDVTNGRDIFIGCD